MKSTTSFLEFDDNKALSILVGPYDKHLLLLEKRLSVSIRLRGHKVEIAGDTPDVLLTKKTLEVLYRKILKNEHIDLHEIEFAIKSSMDSITKDTNSESFKNVSVATKRRVVFARTANQAQYIQAIKTHDLIFGEGPAGTGKTYLAVAVGISMLLAGEVDRIILSRPAVEAGEKLGFLPGDMKEKVDPYLRPLYDALHDMLPSDQVIRRINNGEIEIAPLAFMRGRTLANSFVILDEAQNTTTAQMKMFLTRLGQHSRMIINGDLSQIDLPHGVESGLHSAMGILKDVPDISIVTFNEADVVRHPLVSKIVHAYDVISKRQNILPGGHSKNSVT